MIGFARAAKHLRIGTPAEHAGRDDDITQATGFEPVGAELLRRARDEADRMIAGAQAESAAEVERARAEAAEITERARAAGLAQAVAEAAARQRRSRLDDRTASLSARREAYDNWRDAALAAVSKLRSAPGYERIDAELRDAAQRLLGPDARITEDPDGGLIAETVGRRVDLRLSTIAARAVEDTEPEIERLWT